MKGYEDAAKKWINALNIGNVDALVDASEPDIAIIGPRGTAKGVDTLRQWYMGTHLTLDLKELLKHGNEIIALGMAHWHNDDGSELGSTNTAFLMKISAQDLVAELSRHDDGLSGALNASSAPDRLDWQTTSIV